MSRVFTESINLEEHPAKYKIAAHRVRKAAYDVLFPILLPLLIILLWEATSSLGLVHKSILPPPSRIIRTGIELINKGTLAGHLLASLRRVFSGYVIGLALGLFFGILAGLYRHFLKSLSLLVGSLRPIPMVAWIPMLILWMGIAERSKIAVIVIGTFWPVFLNTLQGIKTVDEKYLEVARILEKNRFTTLTNIVFPAALPSIFTGVRLGISSAWMSVVASEMIAASRGVGFLISYAREMSQPHIMWVGIAIIGLSGLILDTIIIQLERRVLYWS
jgi:sulfonate transport system permease protein